MFGIWLVPLLLVGIVLALSVYYGATGGLEHLAPIVERATGPTLLHWIVGAALLVLLAFAIIVNWDS